MQPPESATKSLNTSPVHQAARHSQIGCLIWYMPLCSKDPHNHDHNNYNYGMLRVMQDANPKWTISGVS